MVVNVRPGIAFCSFTDSHKLVFCERLRKWLFGRRVVLTFESAEEIVVELSLCHDGVLLDQLVAEDLTEDLLFGGVEESCWVGDCAVFEEAEGAVDQSRFSGVLQCFDHFEPEAIEAVLVNEAVVTFAGFGGFNDQFTAGTTANSKGEDLILSIYMTI